MATNNGLHMVENWIYESILCTGSKQEPNLAPIGVRKRGDDLVLDLFKGSRTQKNLESYSDFTINFPPDAGYFFSALHDRGSLILESALEIESLLLPDVPLVIEARVLEAKDSAVKQRVIAREVCRHVRGNPKLYNRAEPLLLESLIAWTRRGIMPRERLEEILRENQRVIDKVAPGSRYSLHIASLLSALQEQA